MVTIDKITSLLKKDESFSKYIYTCTKGKRTIGYGFNLDEGMTVKEAELILDEKVKYYRKMASTIFSDLDAYSNNRQLAIVNMMYNLGVPKFLTFFELIKAIKIGHWSLAADNVKYRDAVTMDKITPYYRQVGARADRIMKMLEEG